MKPDGDGFRLSCAREGAHTHTHSPTADNATRYTGLHTGRRYTTGYNGSTDKIKYNRNSIPAPLSIITSGWHDTCHAMRASIYTLCRWCTYLPVCVAFSTYYLLCELFMFPLARPQVLNSQYNNVTENSHDLFIIKLHRSTHTHTRTHGTRHTTHDTAHHTYRFCCCCRGEDVYLSYFVTGDGGASEGLNLSTPI